MLEQGGSSCLLNDAIDAIVCENEVGVSVCWMTVMTLWMDDGFAELELNGNCSGSNLAHCKSGTFCDFCHKCSKCSCGINSVRWNVFSMDVVSAPSANH